MVKANEEITQGVQPQEKPTSDADEQVTMMFKALEKNYNEEKITERV